MRWGFAGFFGAGEKSRESFLEMGTERKEGKAGVALVDLVGL